MESKAGWKPSIKEMPQLKDRLTFLYLEKCQISRDSNALMLSDINGDVLIPAAAISVLLLGPGTQITHRAIELAGESGISIVWTGDQGVRYYVSGRPLTSSSSLLIRQAELVSNRQKHLEVVRRMYKLRFPDETVDGLTVQQLRGKEGARMKKTYQEQALKWRVPWTGRKYEKDSFDGADPVNQSLSAGNACLYGLAHAVIASLGLSPGLGFIHTGSPVSFVYDLADLYKAETTIPLAFELASQPNAYQRDISGETRRRMRDVMYNQHLINRMIQDLNFILKESEEEEDPFAGDVYLWNNYKEAVRGGVLYE